VKQKLQVAKIVKYTKLAVGIIISLVVIFLIYLGIKALINASWASIGMKALHILIMLIFVGIIVGIFVLLSKSFKNVEEYYKNDDNLKWYGYPLYILYNLIKWPLKGVWAVLSFFFSYFSAAKDNYCPGIIWEDSEKVNK